MLCYAKMNAMMWWRSVAYKTFIIFFVCMENGNLLVLVKFSDILILINLMTNRFEEPTGYTFFHMIITKGKLKILIFLMIEKKNIIRCNENSKNVSFYVCTLWTCSSLNEYILILHCKTLERCYPIHNRSRMKKREEFSFLSHNICTMYNSMITCMESPNCDDV